MRNTSSLLHSCAIIIPLAHALIFLSLFFPLGSQNPGEPPRIGWEWFFPCNPSTPVYCTLYPSRIVLDMSVALSVLMVLALPPLASVAVLRSRWSRIGLLGLWISLPLTLTSCLYFVGTWLPWSEVYHSVSPAVWLRFYLSSLAASPAAWLPIPGLALSFLACLVLALRLPLVGAREQARVPISRSLHLEASQHASAAQVASSSEGEAAHATSWGSRPLFACIGLLCHLVIGLSLFFTYTDTFAYELTTGWQLLGEALQGGILLAAVAMLLLAALVLPLPIYLTSLLPSSWKSDRTARLLYSGASISKVLILLGLSLSGTILLLSWLFRGWDHENPVGTPHLAFVVPPLALLLSLWCITVLIGSGVRRHAG
jgi:hypothetical protein